MKNFYGHSLPSADSRRVVCASVYLCLVVTCWENAHLLALVCGV